MDRLLVLLLLLLLPLLTSLDCKDFGNDDDGCDGKVELHGIVGDDKGDVDEYSCSALTELRAEIFEIFSEV